MSLRRQYVLPAPGRPVIPILSASPMPPTRRQKYASRYKRVFIVFEARSHSGPRGPANGWSRAARLYVGCGGGPTGGGNGLRKGGRTSWRRTLRTIRVGVSVRRAI